MLAYNARLPFKISPAGSRQVGSLNQPQPEVLVQLVDPQNRGIP
jgi:hypothetical protein